jgi:3-methyladenine DNA glycosylase AlkD
MNVAGEVRAVRAALAAAGTPARAAGAKAYLKSDLAFLGADTPTLRRVGGALAARVKGDGDTSLRPLVDALWRTRVHELRAVAIVLLERRVSVLDAGDLPRIERFLRESRTWAYVDWISTKILASMLLRIDAVRTALPRWARDDDFWMRRTALLTLMPPVVRGQVPFSAFSVLAIPMLGEREFFIRKAIGWVLRAVSKQSPAVVAEFLRTHRADVSGLTMREGAKYLPARDRRDLLGAAAARRRERPT